MNSFNILIVDDEKMITKALSRLIESNGGTANAFTSSSGALESLKTNNYDLAILDYLMPDINGEEMLGWIKQNKPDMSVIMITAYSAPEVQERLINLGADKILIKPFKDINDVYNSIISILSIK